jgi:hypothetical protein
MRQVYVCHLDADAELARSLLANYGIAACVVGGRMPGGGRAPTVWVLRDEDEGRAIALIRQHRDRPIGHGGPWLCRICEEENQGGFSECWNCRAVNSY